MTLQEHYNAIKDGKGNKTQFLKQARSLFPQYFNQYSDFDTTTNVLKSKQIISEAAGGVISKGFNIYDWKNILGEEVKATEKETSKEVTDKQAHAFQPSDMKNVDNINFNEIMKGFFAEMYDEKNKGKTGDEIKAIVVKNLAKDPLYYTKNGNFSTMGVGYTDEAPGLGKNTQPKDKNASVLGGSDEVNSESDIVKNSLVGSAKKNVQDTLGNKEAKTSDPKKVKEMPVAPQNASGVKKMATPGAEKKIKLKESVTGENPYFDTDPSDGDADHESNMRYGAENYYDKGLEAFKNGDLEKAQEYYEHALEFGSWLGWTERDLPPYSSLQENSINESYEDVIKSNEYDYDTAYAWLEDQGLSTMEINAILDKIFPTEESLAEQTLRSLIRNIIKEELK